LGWSNGSGEKAAVCPDEKGFAGLLSSPLMASLLFFCLAEIFGDKREKEWFSRRVSNNF
jgi:hypothetical protein